MPADSSSTSLTSELAPRLAPPLPCGGYLYSIPIEAIRGVGTLLLCNDHLHYRGRGPRTSELRRLVHSQTKVQYFFRYDAKDIIIIPANHLARRFSGSHHATTELETGRPPERSASNLKCYYQLI